MISEVHAQRVQMSMTTKAVQRFLVYGFRSATNKSRGPVTEATIDPGAARALANVKHVAYTASVNVCDHLTMHRGPEYFVKM